MFFVRGAFFYSPKGLWGLLAETEYFGLLGGTQRFMEQMSQKVPTLKTQIFDWLQQLQVRISRPPYTQTSPFPAPWLYDLLNHMYGEVFAIEMLEKYEFPKIRAKGRKGFVKPRRKNRK